jgi:large conductance mechanosensitive channel
MFREFKEFALRGNVFDLAIAVIIGTAFGRIVSSIVADVLMPPLGFLLGRVDLKRLSVLLGTDPAGKPVTLNYGTFLQTVFDFLIIALVIFLVVKGVNRLQRQEPPPPPNTKDCPRCVSKIPVKATKCAYCTVDLG